MVKFEVSDGFAGIYSWQTQYFEKQNVAKGVVIPMKDPLAWLLYPRHRWVYNKMLVCETHGPHGVLPETYPVFSKPIVSMFGMGSGSRMVANEDKYMEIIEPGYFWMPLFKGRHVSTDVALANGTPCWWQHATGVPGREPGTFDYWIIHAPDAALLPALEAYLSTWISKNMQGYTDFMNIESIGGRIIECHLRMTAQWPDLNGEGWLDAVANLYAHGVWSFDNNPKKDGYSDALFSEPGRIYKVDHQAVKRLLPAENVSSIGITFDESLVPEHHSMPLGGFRLAVINCWDFDAGFRMRDTLKPMFTSKPL